MINIENVFLKFEGKKIFNNYNLRIKNGEKIILNSPSGRGKSTLLKIIMGFQRIDSGNIWINGEKISKHNIDNTRKKIAYIPQMLNFPDVNVKNLIIEIFRYDRNKSKTLNEKELLDYINFFSLTEDILTKEFSMLSGGEKQRIALIIALLLDKEIFLLDEITSSLDVVLKEKVMKFLEKTNKTILMITHDRIDSLKNFKVVSLDD